MNIQCVQSLCIVGLMVNNDINIDNNKYLRKHWAKYKNGGCIAPSASATNDDNDDNNKNVNGEYKTSS